MSFERSQADAIAQAIMQPDPEAQAALQARRAHEAMQLARQRRASAVALVGMAIRGTVGQIAFDAFSRGLLLGGALAYLLARLIQRRVE
jgi:hypothetical protein